MRYQVAAPDLSGNEAKYVQECIESTWISSQGRFLDEFEARLARFTGTRHAVATCNGTVALHLALAALGLGPGDEVVVPTLTFIATANAVRYCGAAPVFADSDPVTGGVDPRSVERLIGPRTRGILPVHLWGHPCDMDALADLAARRHLWILEDAAEAIGAEHRGRRAGSLGRAGVFSFFGNKIVTTGEGGAATTDDDRLAARMRLLRGQGMTPEKRYWHETLGFNYRMTNLAAAVGVAQMERAEELVDRRRALAAWYREELFGNGLVTLPTERPGFKHAYWMYSVLLPAGVDRGRVAKRLAAREVETRPFFHPAHQMPMYVDCASDGGCPTACDLSRRGLSLPSSSYLTRRDAAFVAGALLEAVRAELSVRSNRRLAA